MRQCCRLRVPHLPKVVLIVRCQEEEEHANFDKRLDVSGNLQLNPSDGVMGQEFHTFRELGEGCYDLAILVRGVPCNRAMLADDLYKRRYTDLLESVIVDWVCKGWSR